MQFMLCGGYMISEKRAKKYGFWKYFEEKDPVLYKKLRHGIFGTLLLLPGKAGRRIIVTVYKIAQKIFNFN